MKVSLLKEGIFYILFPSFLKIYSLFLLHSFFMAYQTNWNLARYFYTGLDDPKLASDIDSIRPMTQTFSEKYKISFSQFTTPEQILEFYADYTEFSHMIATPSYYLFYLSSLDTQNLDVTKKMGELDFIYNDISNELLFIAQ